MNERQKLLKNIGITVAVFVFAFFSYQFLIRKGAFDTLVTETAPDEEIRNIKESQFDAKFVNEDNQEEKLSDYLGKPIVVNVWASWCKPCRAEMPEFEKVYKEEKDVVFLFINQTDGKSETKDTAKEFIANEKLDIPIKFDINNEMKYKFIVKALPTTYFIDKKGNVQGEAAGRITEKTLKEQIEEIK